jgi:hypothetical protein
MTDATEKVDLAFLARQNEKILDEVRATRRDVGSLAEREDSEAVQTGRRFMQRYARTFAALAKL